jgi:hypothetical protein
MMFGGEHIHTCPNPGTSCWPPSSAWSINGMVNQRQQQIIEFQNAQIEALLKKLGRKRLLLDNDQRRLLVVKAHAIGCTALLELTTIVTPDTILRWHHGLHDRRNLDAERPDHVLAVMHLRTRRVHIAGITSGPMPGG